jgi:hypothetical protein
MKKRRKGAMRISQRIGVAMMLAGVLLLIMSEDPYLYGSISTKDFLCRFVWTVILWFSGMNLYRSE